MMEIKEVVKVGIADMNVCKSPSTIRTSGLGSCVGVIIYDEERQICGLAHVMLPESSLSRNGTINIAKYADTAVKELVNMVVKAGARASYLKAKIAGGAQMFQFSSTSDTMRIGPRNVEAVKNELRKLNIRIISEDCGGNSGRTIEFDPAKSTLQIRTVNKGIHDI